MKKHLIYILIFLLAFPPMAWAANFYCDCSVGGGTGGAGTYADPFESIADINAYKNATGFATGDDIYFLEGSTCSATAYLDIEHSGQSGNYSIFGCYDGEGDFDCDGAKPILQISMSYNFLRFDTPTGQEYLRFQDLDVRATESPPGTPGSAGIAVHDNQGGGHIQIVNCDFSGWAYYAVKLENMGDWNVITDNTFDTNGNGVYFIDDDRSGYMSSYNYIARNTFTDTNWLDEFTSPAPDGHAITLQSSSYTIIEDNVSTNAQNSYNLFIMQGDSAIHNVVRRNRATNGGEHGSGFHIMFEDRYGCDARGEDCYGNLFYQNYAENTSTDISYGKCFEISSMHDTSGRFNYVFNNTCYDAEHYGLGTKYNADHFGFFNNIVVTDGVTSTDDLVHTEVSGYGAPTDFSYDYNLYWTTPNTDPSSYSLWTDETETARTWSAWKATAGQDTNSPSPANPNFTDTVDFELESDSPAIDAGGWLTYVTSATGSGTTINVNNTYILHDDMGLLDEDGSAVEGMLISLYDTTNGRQDREITGISYGTSITLNSSANWIYNASYPNNPAYTTQIALRFNGSAPDIGAFEYQGGDVTPPQLSTAIISTNGTTLTLTFSENVTQGSGYHNADWDIDCTIGGSNVGISYVSGNTTTAHVYAIEKTIYQGETCNIDFNGDADSEEDGAGNDLAAIVSDSVTNNSTQSQPGYADIQGVDLE